MGDSRIYQNSLVMINIYDFLVKSRLFNKFEVDDLLFVEYHCIGEEERMSYWTDNNCFVFIVKGKKKWETTNHEYYVSAGEAVFIRKGACIVNQYFDEDLCALVIFVPDHFIKDVLQKNEVKHSDIRQVPYTDNIIPIRVNEILSTYFLSVYNYFTQASRPPKDLLRLKFTELIMNIMMSPENNILARHFSKLCEESPVSVREVMESNFAYNLKLEEYARMSARSLSTFKRDFNREFGISPGKWLTLKRLEYARFLLEATGKTIREIVFDSGFENTSHFTRIFRNKYGIPPRQYRVRQHSVKIAR